ncbi:MAG: Gfo/Idh/MocA family oxidoreductase [Planctomycetes bacterium]|nr:Gfo/Idh/MocA family oxidoreductase [Planctomycetota bacterium]MBM4078517.1 Gfo/Idh/MocA family oxidoreductase [Planctomycetota bacterium]MBM4084286.1 Gfo/Idh/MocA family oxidoreductase [Planctomycetota bacterium]
MLKVAMLGCGPVGKTHHAPAFAATEGVKLVAACDLVEEKAKALAAQYSIPHYTDAAKMLEKEEIDCVDVCMREQWRPEPLMMCLRAGKHVFTEKPLAGAKGQYNVEEGDLATGKKILDVWRASGKFFGINFNYRTAPHAKALKAAIDRGDLGQPILINVYAHLDCWSHVIDLMRWFNGEVDEVMAYMGNEPAGKTRTAALKFQNGTIGALIGVTKNREKLILRIEYLGTLGKLVISELTGPCEFYPEDPKKPKQVLWAPADGNPRGAFGQTFRDSVQNFARAVRDGQAPPVTGLDAYRELEIDAALPMSASRHAPVKIEHY